MTFSLTRFLGRLAAGALLLGLATGVQAADTVKWTIVVKPSGAGTVEFDTSSPDREGSTSGRKVVSFDKDGFLNVYISSSEGFELASFRKDDQEMIFFLDIFNHFEFGPVSGSHTLTVQFVPVLPEGTFDLSAPTKNPAFTNVSDLTGSYVGTTPTVHARGYTVDVAQDESGRLTGMATVEGIEPVGGGAMTGATGKVSTVNGDPMVSAKGTFKGTRDGVEAKGKGALSGPAELQGPGDDALEGDLTYKGKGGGVPFKDKNVPVSAPLEPASTNNIRQSWSLSVDLVKHDVTKAKPYVAASAVLSLPNGDVVTFAEKKAKYTPKNGLKIVFKKGMNVTVVPSAVDKKTKVIIKNMTLAQVGDDWVITGGTMKYKLLGQKGVADVLDFLEP